MRNLIRKLSVVLLVLLLPACSTSPKTNFYYLTPGKDVQHENENTFTEKASIGLWKIKLPELIDRPEIVTKTGPYTIELADFHHWADDLENNISTLVASEVAHDLNTRYVDISPWRSSRHLDYQIKIDIRDFIGELDGEIKLKGAYVILSGKGGKNQFEEPFALSEKTKGKTYDDIVSAMSRLIIRLSSQISTAMSAQINSKK